MGESKSVKGHLCAILAILVWGTTFVSTKVLLAGMLPVEILLVRFGVGTLALCLVYPKRMRLRERRHHLLFLGAGLTGVTLYFLTENIALTYTSAANVSVIVSVSPLFTGLLLRLVEPGQKLRLNFFAGFAAALAGIGIISFAGSQLALNPLGDLLALLSAAAWAVYSLLLKKISALGYPSLGITRLVFLYGLLFMLPAALFMGAGPGFAAALVPQNLANLLYLGLGASMLCFITWNFAIKQLGPVKSSAYIYAIPVVTVVSSWLVLGEGITPAMLAGILLTLSGLVLSELQFGKSATQTKGIESGKQPGK